MYIVTQISENHIDCLDSAILIDRKRGEFFQLKFLCKGSSIFKAVGTNNLKEGYLSYKKIIKGLLCKRYRILECKN